MAMRALLWSFGGAEQDEAGNVTINSKQTIEALKFMKELYTQTETPEVFTWTPPSNNQAMLAGRVSYVANAISVTRQSEREKLPIDSKIMISPALKGPGPAHRGRARHELPRDLGVRGEQGRRAEVPDRLHGPLP